MTNLQQLEEKIIKLVPDLTRSCECTEANHRIETRPITLEDVLRSPRPRK